MVEYDKEFTIDFMRRTMDLVRQYDGPYDATLLINCLIGLLIVPKEVMLNKVPETDFNSLETWGINPGSIKHLGRCSYGHVHEPNLRQLVKKLRNAVAHFNIQPLQKDGKVVGYSFKDQDRFHAEVSLDEMKTFVTKLAAHLEREA